MVKNKVENVLVSKGQSNGLIEPQGCVQIPTHMEEMEEIQKTNAKPSYIVNYLMYAENFAKDHFAQDKLEKLQHYAFKDADLSEVNDKDEKSKCVINRMIRDYGDQGDQSNLNLAQSLNKASFNMVKSYTEFVNIKKSKKDTEHFILIKTWELVNPNLTLLQKKQNPTTGSNLSSIGKVKQLDKKEDLNIGIVRTGKKRNGATIPAIQAQSYSTQQSEQKSAIDQPSEQSFYIKTIKIFDQYLKNVDNILVEQIQMSPGSKLKDYNTSVLTDNKSIYYYKRLYDSNSNKTSDIECSQLRLFQYNFNAEEGKREKMMSEDYQINETTTQKSQIQTGKEEPLFHHVMFSKTFDTSPEKIIQNNNGIDNQPTDDHLTKQFLDQQFILLTQYQSEESVAIKEDEVTANEKKTIPNPIKKKAGWGQTVGLTTKKTQQMSTIYQQIPEIRQLGQQNTFDAGSIYNKSNQETKSIKDIAKELKEKELKEKDENLTSFSFQFSKLLKNLSEDQNYRKDKKPQYEQTEFILHKKVSVSMSLQDGKKNQSEESNDQKVECTIFFISDLKSIIQITIPDSTSKPVEPHEQWLVQRNICNQKIDLFNQEIQVQSILLDIHGDQKKKETCNQFFFIDQRNNIQLLYPSYKQKVQQQQIIKFVQDQSGINAKYTEFCNFKKIQVYEDIATSESCKFKNYFQQIDHLNKIVKDKTITQDHVLTFVSNPIFETLLITDVKNPTIIKYIQFKQFSNAHSDFTSRGRTKTGEDENHDLVRQVLKENEENLNKDNQQQILYNLIQVQSQAGNQQKAIDPSKVNLLNFSDSKIEVQCYDPDILKDFPDKEIKLVSYQRSNTKERLTQFVFSIVDTKQLRKKKEYMFVSKTMKEMTAIFNSRCKQKILALTNDECSEGGKPKLFVYNKKEEKSSKKNMWDAGAGAIVEDMTKDLKQIEGLAKKDDKKEKEDDDYNKQAKPQNYNDCFTEISLEELLKNDEINSQSDSQKNQDKTKSKDEKVRDKKKSQDQKVFLHKLVFSEFQDQQENINFIPFIYQEIFTSKVTKILVFDIQNQRIDQSNDAQLVITPQSESNDLVILGRDGFDKLQIARSSNVFQLSDTEYAIKDYDEQQAKYAVVTYYKEQLGKIMLREYMVRCPIAGDENRSIQINNFSMRQIFFSKQMLHNPGFNYTQNMHIIPFHNEKGSIKGCQMIWFQRNKKTQANELKNFNMFDQENNNIYKYKSQIIYGGVKRQLMKDDEISKGYIVIVSASLKSDFILKHKFDNTEIYSLIWQAQNVLCNMKVPTLENILLKSLAKLGETEFFVKHEFLYGKSICDICIKYPFMVKNALDTYDKQIKEPEGSAIIELCKNDRVRKEFLKRTGAIKDVLLIGIDLNLTGTIFNAIELKAFKSIQCLFDYILNTINTVDYQKWFMFDLKDILGEKSLNIYEFFERSDEEKLDKRNEGEFCNIELTLESNKLPTFSDKAFQSQKITNVQDCTYFKHELIDEISKLIDKDMEVKDSEGNLEVEHSYVNFQYMIMGEKIKHLKKNLPDFKLDHLTLSEMMNDKLLEFYSMETIQDMIQIQWDTAQKFTIYQFRIYYLFFALPYIINLLCNQRIVEFWWSLPPFGSQEYYKDKELQIQEMQLWLTWIQKLTIKINIFPQLMLLFIECVQFKQQRLKYFFGWNIIDASQICAFFFYAIGTLTGCLKEEVFVPDSANDGLNGNLYLLKLIILMLSWIKMIFYLRTFESYGLLIQMAIFCIIDLTQFILFYFLLLLLFTCCFYILGEEVYQLTTMDDVAQNLPYFIQLYLFQYQTSLEYLYVPYYNKSIFHQQPINSYGEFKNPIPFNQRTAVFLLWMLWFLITYLLNILMINFIVAVIINSYEQVKNKQRIISFRQRADLNYECYQIGNVLENLGLHRIVKFWLANDDQFKIIVMTTSKDNYEMKEDSQVTETGEKLIKFMKNQNHQILQKYNQNKVDLKKIDESADNIQQMIEKNFDQMGEKFRKMNEQIKDIFKVKTEQDHKE